MKFAINDFFGKCNPNTQDRISPYKDRIVDAVFIQNCRFCLYTRKYGPADRVIFIEEIFNGKLYFFVQCGLKKLLIKNEILLFWIL